MRLGLGRNRVCSLEREAPSEEKGRKSHHRDGLPGGRKRGGASGFIYIYTRQGEE